MPEPFDAPDEPRPRREEDYQDSRFHDDDEIVPADDVEPQRTRLPGRRKPSRRLLPRRHWDED
jgi:hypothetical protein